MSHLVLQFWKIIPSHILPRHFFCGNGSFIPLKASETSDTRIRDISFRSYHGAMTRDEPIYATIPSIPFWRRAHLVVFASVHTDPTY